MLDVLPLRPKHQASPLAPPKSITPRLCSRAFPRLARGIMNRRSLFSIAGTAAGLTILSGTRTDAQQAPSATRLANLEDRPVLQAEELDGPAGQPKASWREGEAGRGAVEQRVPELLAQLADVQRDRGLGHVELSGRSLHRPPAYDGREARSWVGVTRLPSTRPSG